MRKHILVHCKSCATCAKQRVQKTQFEKQIFEPGCATNGVHLHTRCATNGVHLHQSHW